MVGERLQQYLNILAFPATKTQSVGQSVFISSVMNPFEWSSSKSTLKLSTGDTLNYPAGSGFLGTWGAFGAAKIVCRAADKSKISADSTLINVYVSFDKGVTYQTWASYRFSGTNGGVAGAATPNFLTIPFAPRMYISATFTGALTAGHGLAVDVEFEEYMPENYRTVSTVTWPSSNYTAYNGVGANLPALSPDTWYYADSLFSRASTTITLSQFTRPQRVCIVGWSSDRSKIAAQVGTSTKGLPVWLQSSLDGNTWFNADTIYVSKPTNGTGIFAGEEEAKPWPVYIPGAAGLVSGSKEPGIAKPGVLSKFMRLQYGPNYLSSGTWVTTNVPATNTGPRYWVISLY